MKYGPSTGNAVQSFRLPEARQILALAAAVEPPSHFYPFSQMSGFSIGARFFTIKSMKS